MHKYRHEKLPASYSGIISDTIMSVYICQYIKAYFLPIFNSNSLFLLQKPLYKTGGHFSILRWKDQLEEVALWYVDFEEILATSCHDSAFLQAWCEHLFDGMRVI